MFCYNTPRKRIVKSQLPRRFSQRFSSSCRFYTTLSFCNKSFNEDKGLPVNLKELLLSISFNGFQGFHVWFVPIPDRVISMGKTNHYAFRQYKKDKRVYREGKRGYEDKVLQRKCVKGRIPYNWSCKSLFNSSRAM